MFSYIAYYQGDEVEWLIVDLCHPFFVQFHGGAVSSVAA